MKLNENQIPDWKIKKISVYELPQSGIYKRKNIPSMIKNYYKAAGIIPFCFKNNKSFVLLGSEYRGRDNVFSEFGGKREESDVSIELTAIREFMEETNEIYKDILKDQNNYLDSNLSKDIIWNASGKYGCFLLKVPNFILSDQKNEEKNKLIWVPLENLFDKTSIVGYSDLDLYFDKGIPENDKRIHPHIKIFNFFKITLGIKGVKNYLLNFN
eukprot:TRINITY_DN13100_c0_g1_i1.p1 TRINITY_DN13100_c0_g1~~TRINITY_DN13100_c0_g1_i1.p1  ORF type:complete len:230 (-),score=50.56 TRINITY_DN13100_c0_g1_i1:15-653(-)